MYRIITDNEKILKYAKECGAQILEIKKPLVVEIGRKDKRITSDMVDSFLLKFDNIDMESIEMQVLKYILHFELGCTTSERICSKVKKLFNLTHPEIDKIIGRAYAELITKLPAEYKKHFENYECYIHMQLQYRYDFLKACQEYLNQNTAIVDNSGDKLYIVL